MLNIERVKTDLEYIFLNRLVSHIPSWNIRRQIYIWRGVRIGQESRIGIGATIISPKGILIGKRSVVNENCVLDGRGNLVIGNDTSISMFTKLISASHKMNSKEFSYCTRKTIIGDNVWIGTGAIILDGTEVQNHVVVGAGAVVRGKCLRSGVYIGNPAICVKMREQNEKYKLNYKPYFR